MPTILKELELGELSLVDNPANPLAKAPLFKRHTEGDTMEDVIKMSDKMKERMKYYMQEKGMSEADARKACMSEMEKAWDYRAEVERLTKALIDNGFRVGETIEKKAPEEFIEVEGEQINKADIPAPILKALEAAEVQKRQIALEKRAEAELPHFDKEVAMGLLKFDLDEKILSALKAADAAFEAAMTEKGQTSNDVDLSDAETELNKRLEKIKTEKGLTKEQAFAELAKDAEGRALIAKSYYKKED